MKRPIIRSIAIAIGILSLFAVLLIKSQAIDFPRHNLYVGHIRQLDERDARLNQNILLARYGTLQYYDPINHEFAELKQLQSYLSKTPGFIGRVGQKEIQQILQDYVAVLQQKKALGESFKTQNATLKNSLAYFPIAIAQVADQVVQDNTVPEFAARLNRLLRDVLMYSLTPSKELNTSISQQLDTIRNRQELLSAVVLSELEIALSHAEIVLQHLSPVNALVQNIIDLPTTQLSGQLAQTYEFHYQNAFKTENAYRFWLYLLSLVLLIATAASINIKLRRSSAAIRQAEAKYHSIVENSVNGIAQITPEGQILSANPALARIYGYDSPERLCKNVVDVDRTLYVSPDHRSRFKRLVEQEGSISDFELQVYRQDGTPIWISESARAVRDRKGKLLYYEGTVVDTTVRKQMETCLRQEQSKSERLLLNILPKEIAEQLKQSSDTLAQPHKEALIAEQFDQATILFADIVNFTPLSAQMSAKELVNLLNQIFSLFDRLAQQYSLEKIKTIGDAYMVAGGLPMPRNDHAEAISEMALGMQAAISTLQVDTGKSFQIRVGINTGPVIAGVIGRQKFSYDLWGDAVNVAARMESTGMPGQIQVTEYTYKLLQDKYEFQKRGAIAIKGKGDMTTYWLLGRKACEV